MAGLFRASGRSLRSISSGINVAACRSYKTTTGLVGIPVNLNARADLIAAQQKILEAVKAIPADVFYRKSVEKNAKYYLAEAEATEDPLELEAKLSGISGNAQLEELLLQAADEVELIEFYAAEKCWERAPDLRWKADLDADIQADIEREDAANAANSSA
mmetsp:Transcript_3401/g.4985  ORF Transcript_3401/g.4985 Transcript_3401/m.4985 type:complete len:160 (+) Transcript_3401:31-510(+)|eukprot:CAMPEP_0172615538 /NCGR_PEP_ID=MMETSP1068-20121228/60489_1 /TAXON_ID=35684 /ORGANISM="Pseudopedinella elastica, Strain CCMP716" /LENGTH=159 /DNA_ID=CAMNT_0013420719 /DNA_START=70 /DNA_END=549 /DNA_ORIENTATION=+